MLIALQWLGSLLGSIAGFFGLSLAKRSVFAAATIAASSALLLTFALVIKNSISALVYVLPDWAAGGAMFLPSNLPLCVSAIITAKLAFLFYQYNLTNLKIISTIN